MTKAELESKTLSDLHALAAEAGVPRYRMLSRIELIEKLSEGGSEGSERAERTERPRRRRRRSGTATGGDAGRERRRREPAERWRKPAERAPQPPPSSPAAEGPARPRRRRRRRRFGRRGKEVAIQDLLLPPEAGRQAILCAESREACTALLRGVAADLSGASKGPDPVVLLIDPSPEELAEWKREAPRAEIVAAGQARHASDALAQASARAGAGDDVILLVDSLTRLASAFGDADSAKDLFDAGRAQGGAGGGSLTVVAALER
jgi:transcription termination factor Rho